MLEASPLDPGARRGLRFTLVAAAPPALLAAPRACLDRPGYALRFALEGLPGGVVLQRVHTRVALWSGDRVLVEYRALEWEFFALAPAPEARADLHDFDARRDGWSPPTIERLLRRRGVAAPSATRLEVTKDLLCGPGVVEGAAPLCRTAGGGAFGLLEEGEGEPARVALTLADGPDPAAPVRRVERTGRGRFAGAGRLAARERLEWSPATESGSIERWGYEPFVLLDSGPDAHPRDRRP